MLRVMFLLSAFSLLPTINLFVNQTLEVLRPHFLSNLYRFLPTDGADILVFFY